MTSDFFQQLELPSSIARTAKDKATPFTMVDNRVVNLDWRAAGLKRGDKEVLILLLSLPDDWDFKHMGEWLADRLNVSRATAFRIIKRLRDAGHLARTWDRLVDREGYQVFEVPCENRPKGADARKRHVITGRKARHPRYQKSPSMPRKHHGLLVVENAGDAFLRPTRPVSNLRHIQRTKQDVPPTSEHPRSPLSPDGESGFSDDLRVCGDDVAPDRSARGAKRRKGRKSPAKPHNARKMRRNRAQINMLQIRPKAGTAENFMANLTSESLEAALDELRHLPRTGSDEWVEVVERNPLLAVLFDNLDLKVWGAQSLRRYLRLLGDRLPVPDMLLYWVAERTGQWSGNVPQDMRARFERNHPTAPDQRRDQIYPDLIRQFHTWEERMDTCRGWLADKVTVRAEAFLGDVDLNDPSTIESHPLVWAAVLSSPICGDMCEVEPEVVELARKSLRPVSKAEMVALVDGLSEGLPVRWWGGWCLGGELVTTFGTGVAALLGEALPEDLAKFSGLAGAEYTTRVGAWYAEVPAL